MSKLNDLLLECGMEVGIIETKDICENTIMDKAISESNIHGLFESLILKENSINLLDEGITDDFKRQTRKIQENIEKIRKIWIKIKEFIMQLIKRVKNFILDKLGMYDKILNNPNIGEGLKLIENSVIKGKIYKLDDIQTFLNNTNISDVYTNILKNSKLDQVSVKIKKDGIFKTAIYDNGSKYVSTTDITNAFREIVGLADNSNETNINPVHIKEFLLAKGFNSPKISDLGLTETNIKEFIRGIKNYSSNDEKALLKEVENSSKEIAGLTKYPFADLGSKEYEIERISKCHSLVINYCTMIYQLRLDLLRERAFLAYKVANAAIKAMG